eukprot:6194361-Pleurochrysis_carterae.AAC.2
MLRACSRRKRSVTAATPKTTSRICGSWQPINVNALRRNCSLLSAVSTPLLSGKAVENSISVDAVCPHWKNRAERRADRTQKKGDVCERRRPEGRESEYSYTKAAIDLTMPSSKKRGRSVQAAK